MDSKGKNDRSHSSESKPVTYSRYLQLENLLNLQGGLDGDDNNLGEDELHFIIVHQVFELWFKQVLRELYLARDKMVVQKVDEEVIPFVVHHLKRVNTIMESAIKHFDVVETLLPRDFLVFRARLGTASGFQSFQMREIEILLGLSTDERKAHGHPDPLPYLLKSTEASSPGIKVRQRMENAGSGLTFLETIHRWLFRTPVQGSRPGDVNDEEVVREFVESYTTSIQKYNEPQIRQILTDGGDEAAVRERFNNVYKQAEEFLFALDCPQEKMQTVSRIRAGLLFIESYRELPLLSWPRLLLDSVVQLEENFINFRFHHARMVERVIGKRVGTGGSSGVDYLDQTTKYRIFKELWAVRTLLLPKDLLPPIQNEKVYGFLAYERK